MTTQGRAINCTGCDWGLSYVFTVQGTDHLAPQVISDDPKEVFSYIQEGRNVTFHAHNKRHPQVAWTDPETGQHHMKHPWGPV